MKKRSSRSNEWSRRGRNAWKKECLDIVG